MGRAIESGKVEVRPVFYAGRSAGQLREAGLDKESPVLDEWDVMPAHLAAALEEATALVVLDMLSFPFEALDDGQWEVPLVVVPPEEFGVDVLDGMFGGPVFGRLGFFDRVATARPGLREDLARRYRWTRGQLLSLASDAPPEAASEIQARFEKEASLPRFFGGDRYEYARYWKERGGALSDFAPHRAICSVHHDLGFNKAMHRRQAAVLEPQFAAARDGRAEDAPLDVLEVGAGIGRWAGSFDLTNTRFHGLDVSEDMVEAARTDFPAANFEVLGEDLTFPYEDEVFDLTFTVTVLHHNPTPAKKALVSEMWRVTKPGGRLMFLEDFVAGAGSKTSTVYPMSVLDFVDLVIRATAGRVTLEHVESLRYPRDDLVKAALLCLSKLGTPKKW